MSINSIPYSYADGRRLAVSVVLVATRCLIV